ncbi:BREX-1 system adenine-specific DNA-methyltransferase PglX [Psychrobacter sp. TWR1-1-1]|uniref:BREX-1 system adenine-specific DNA-methyltransferase PglX n=1 Tax=Psychrobacter sp. TWR1-1-1 TaxID=2804665 RepID=UPI003CF61822
MKLADHVGQIRELIEASFDKQFARLGFGKTKQMDDDKVANLPDEVKAKRERFVAMLDNHISETGSYESGREKLLDELTFTLFNRLAAIKVMEAANLFPPILTKQVEHGDRSLGHKMWLEIYPHMRDEELEGIRDYIKFAFDELGGTLPLYSKAYAYALLPDTISLNDIIDRFNAVEKDEQITREYVDGIWNSDDVLGWMYESYNNQKKQAHKDSKDKTEYHKVSLQSQVYTPRWVVQFLVENSLGKMYLEMYPDSEIKDNHRIANAPSTQTRTLKPLHEVKIIDPACGSGNFLLYAFDFFYELYIDQIENYSADYDESDIPKLIIENNLHGIDLDDRAIQLAQLGLFIKAKKKRSSIGEINYNIVSSDFYLPEYDRVRQIFEQGNTLNKNQKELIEKVWSDLQNAYKFGSLVKIDEQIQEQLRAVEERAHDDLFAAADLAEHQSFAETFFKNLSEAVEQYARTSSDTFLTSQTQDAITFLELLTIKYDVAAANPPYTDSADFGSELKKFINDNYKKPYKFSANLYAAFVKRCYELTNDNGMIAMIHPHTFMFIKSFEDVRKFIVNNTHIDVMVDYGLDRVNMFGPGILLDATFYVLSKSDSEDYGLYFNLTNNLQEKFKKTVFFDNLTNVIESLDSERAYKLDQAKLKLIDSWPFIYWISDEFRKKFISNTVGDITDVALGLKTANNNKFLRFHWEIDSNKVSKSLTDKKKWVHYLKGGEFNRWSGNEWLVIEWENSGKRIKEQKNSQQIEKGLAFKQGVTLSTRSVKGVCGRAFTENRLFDMAASSIIYRNNKESLYWIAYSNSKLFNYVLNCFNPTVNKQPEDIRRLPAVISYDCDVDAQACIKIKLELQKTELINPDFIQTPIEHLNNKKDINIKVKEFFSFENYLLSQVAILEARINKKIFEIYELTEKDKEMVLVKEGVSIGELPISEEAHLAYLSEEAAKEFPLNDIKQFISALPLKEFTEEEREKIESGFPTLYQSNNNLEEFCIRHQVNPINVWYWFKQSNVIPKQRMNTMAMEFLADMIRKILIEDEDGIVSLMPNSGGKQLLDLIEEKFYEKGFSTAQYSNFDSVLGRPLNDYINKYFFAELSDHLNLFMYLPKTPFIWHLTSGPEQGFDCYIIIYKWSRDNLMRLRSVYIENRERALQNRQSDLAENESASAQNEKDRIFKQLKEIEVFKGKIDELLEEGYNPILDDGVGKNIAPLQQKKMLAYDVLNAGQLKKYLNADW